MAVFYGFGGFLFGFALPVAVGLYSCSNQNFKMAEYLLKVLFFWLVVNQLFAYLLKLIFDKLSPSLWSIAYTAYPVALLVPKSNVLKLLDDYTVSFFNSGSLGLVKKHLEKMCVVSRKALSAGIKKLQDITTI